MKKIITITEPKEINIEHVGSSPVFAKRAGKLEGMVVKEEKGYILKLGDTLGATGHWPSIKALIEQAELNHGYEFFVED